ncbi:hypothetical protein CROQUDRAFT_655650 [Cronartium quercuum f. sp. fusiforme G11]|uniref:Uncharacterized protein n=1 Tax=Cronartium quercuum f. sp. fusiforme G11 TaxID=708437 RepID=A0A9P6NKX1_9BASI|nr:hypothetical protein CROQUDRAFT_655650 [Cronartium quercuum f. sp. fusiforme G11]
MSEFFIVVCALIIILFLRHGIRQVRVAASLLDIRLLLDWDTIIEIGGLCFA